MDRFKSHTETSSSQIRQRYPRFNHEVRTEAYLQASPRFASFSLFPMLTRCKSKTSVLAPSCVCRLGRKLRSLPPRLWSAPPWSQINGFPTSKTLMGSEFWFEKGFHSSSCIVRTGLWNGSRARVESVESFESFESVESVCFLLRWFLVYRRRTSFSTCRSVPITLQPAAWRPWRKAFRSLVFTWTWQLILHTHTHTHLHSLFGCFWLMKSFRLSNAAEMPCRSALKLCWTNGLLLKVRIISIDFSLLAKTCMKVLSLLVEYCCFREDSQSGWRFPEAAVIWASWLCKLNFLLLRGSELNSFSCVVCTFRQETHERILSNPEDEEDNSGAVANLAMACGCLVCFYCLAVKDTRSLPTSSSSWQICPSWRQSEPLGKCWQPDSHWGEAS